MNKKEQEVVWNWRLLIKICWLCMASKQLVVAVWLADVLLYLRCELSLSCCWLVCDMREHTAVLCCVVFCADWRFNLRSTATQMLNTLAVINTKHLSHEEFCSHAWLRYFTAASMSVEYISCFKNWHFLLSTHADRQGVDISFTVCVFVCLLAFCMVMDFSADNQTSGVKFCTAVHWRSRQGLSHFLWTLLPRSPKSDESASAWARPTRM